MMIYIWVLFSCSFNIIISSIIMNQRFTLPEQETELWFASLPIEEEKGGCVSFSVSHTFIHFPSTSFCNTQIWLFFLLLLQISLLYRDIQWPHRWRAERYVRIVTYIDSNARLCLFLLCLTPSHLTLRRTRSYPYHLLCLRRAALFISFSRVSLLFFTFSFAVSNTNLIFSWLKGRWKVENSSIFALNSSASIKKAVKCLNHLFCLSQ